MSLDKVGVNSLLAVNSWIGMINSNMQGSSRTGFKTTRISFSDGLGVNRVSDDLTIPPSTLSVQGTSIEWGQGSVINSTESTHFAIQGEGFFVLHDENSGKFFLSRDGEFHWSQDGFLVNSAGLKVVSNGHDYVRFGDGDQDIFDPDGNSRQLDYYGNKSLLLVDVTNRDALRMSQYGSTVFEVDGGITTRLKNDFSKTTDGLAFIYDDPLLMPIVDDPDFIASPLPANSPYPDTDFEINFGINGIFNFNTYNPLGAGVDFDYAANSIQHIVTAINAFGATVGGRVSASYDAARDRLSIRNEENGPGSDTQISLSGTNGAALRRFFRLSTTPGVKTDGTDFSPANGILESVLTSTRDIDNSDHAEFNDIGFAGSGPYPALPLTTPIGTLLKRLDDVSFPRYTHDRTTGTVRSESFDKAGMAIGQSTSTEQFDLVFDARISNNSRLIIGIGQDDSEELQSGGFSLVYNPNTGEVRLFQQPKGYDADDVPVQTGTGQFIGTSATAATLTGIPLAGNSHRFAVSMNSAAQLTFSVDGGAVATFNLGGSGQDIGGHLSLRTQYAGAAATSLATDPPASFEISNLYVDFKQPLNSTTAGEMVPVSIPPYSTVDQGEYVNRPRSRIIQSALESSTASLTEYIPMLSLAQKVFSAISKIISTHNAVVDDMNTLLR
ncbi:MAG: hypothetical protein ACO1RX_09665 [Candidatus Sericytochromatia bacterium]